MGNFRIPRFRLLTLFLLIGVSAIVITFYAHRRREQRRNMIQRKSFSELTQRAGDLGIEIRKQLESRYGPGFDSRGGGQMLATDSETPFFDYTDAFSSAMSDDNPAWNVQLRYSAQMSDYPNKHMAIIEYGPGDQSLEFAEFAEEVLAGEKTVVNLKEVAKQAD